MVPSPQQKGAVTRAVHQCIALAEHIYEIRLAHTEVRFDLDNDNLAEASMSRDGTKLTLSFNPEHVCKSRAVLIQEVVPHEVAHLVAFVLEPEALPWNHGPEWRRVVRSLGGQGDEYVDPEEHYG